MAEPTPDLVRLNEAVGEAALALTWAIKVEEQVAAYPALGTPSR